MCAPDRQTTFIRAGHSASWSTFLTADEKCGHCILVHCRCCCRDIGDWRTVIDHWSRRCIKNVIGEVLDLEIELGHVRIDIWLVSRTGDVPARAVSLSRSGPLDAAAPQKARQIAFSSIGASSNGTAPTCSTSSCAAGFSLLGSSSACSEPRSPSSAALLTLSFASHQLLNHISEKPLRFSPRGSRWS